MRTPIALAASFLVLGAVLPSPAAALKVDSFEVRQVLWQNQRPRLHVSYDLQKDNWTAATAAPVSFHLHYRIVLTTHVQAAGSVLMRLSFGVDNAWQEDTVVSSRRSEKEFSRDVSVIKSGSQLDDLRRRAIQACQTVRSNGGNPDRERMITATVPIWSTVHLDSLAPPLGGQQSNRTTLGAIDFVCDAHPGWHQPIQPPGGPAVATDPGPFRVLAVDLFLTTYEGHESHPTPGTSCKKVKVTVRIETNKLGGPVAFKLWSIPGTFREEYRHPELQLSGPLKGRFIAEAVFVDSFEQTTNARYMAQVLRHAQLSTPWKDITVVCSGALATGTPPPPGADLPTFRVTAAEVKIIGVSERCPTKAFLTATFFTNMAGKFRYFISSSTGPTASGELQAEKVGGVFRAQETLTVDVTRTGKLIAHARATDFPQAHAFANRTYDCRGLRN